MVRAPFYDQNGLKKGAWSTAEDDRLRSYIQKYGLRSWRQLPKLAGLNRCYKSCRLRWMNYLRPGIKRGNFTKEEDDMILQLHQEFGNRWSFIATKLPGRTDNEIKNHWHAHLRKRAKQNQTTSSMEDPQPGETLLSRSESAESCSISADDLPHPILESSPLSPEISYVSAKACSSTFDHGSTPCPLTSDHGLGPSEILMCKETSSGDFWTEPFVVENITSNQSGFAGFSDLLIYHDEPVDLFYQVMQEFPIPGL